MGRATHSKLRRFIERRFVNVEKKLLAVSIVACLLGGCATTN